MHKLIIGSMTILTIGCCVETDDVAPINQEQKEVIEEKPQENLKPPPQPEEEPIPGNCEDAYQVIVLRDEVSKKEIVVLIPIPCDPRPYIDLGRPSPMTL